MTTFALITHVFIGLIGVGASYAVLLGLFKRELDMTFLLRASVVAFFGYVLAYLAGAYYYDTAYKAGLEALIRAGDRPWVDLFFMEAKGRIFLLLPYLSGAVVATLYGCREALASDATLKRALVFVALAPFLIGVFVALSGVVISGGL